MNIHKLMEGKTLRELIEMQDEVNSKIFEIQSENGTCDDIDSYRMTIRSAANMSAVGYYKPNADWVEVGCINKLHLFSPIGRVQMVVNLVNWENKGAKFNKDARVYANGFWYGIMASGDKLFVNRYEDHDDEVGLTIKAVSSECVGGIDAM